MKLLVTKYLNEIFLTFNDKFKFLPHCPQFIKTFR